MKIKWICLAIAVLGVAGAVKTAQAQEITGNSRLVDNFIQDGAVLRQGWLEGGASYADWGAGHDSVASLRIAFAAMEKIEMGAQLSYLERQRSGDEVLFGERLSEDVSENGFGDMVLYGKLRFRTEPRDWSAGLLVKFPTGDDGERLGSGGTDYEAFLATRHTRKKSAWIANASLRLNGDASTPGGANGETSVALGGGAIFKISYTWSFLAETRYETRRYEGGGVDFRITPTFDFRPTENLAFRLGVAFGLAEGSPDEEMTFGAVFHF